VGKARLYEVTDKWIQFQRRITVKLTRRTSLPAETQLPSAESFFYFLLNAITFKPVLEQYRSVSVMHTATRCHNPKDLNLNLQRHKNLKCRSASQMAALLV
jgi:hypothetical protein